MSDAAIDAVRLSRAARRPVLVQWTRAEEFRLSPHRPVLDARVRGALDASGRIVGWQYEARTNPHTYGGSASWPRMVELTAGRNAVPPYSLGAASVLLHVVAGEVRTGAYRSLAAAPHVFAIESFIDELARAAGVDSIAFRLRHVNDPRMRRVLELVRERSGWTQRLRQPARGAGVACAVYHGTYVAEVAEVSVAPNHESRVNRVWCAVDCGRLVHQDGARNQIEGGVQQAASWAMFEELRQEAGRVTTDSWLTYRIATMNDAPRDIDVTFVDDPATASTGVGEPGSVPTAAALANAVYDACGTRVRRLPLTAEHVRLAAAPLGDSRHEGSN
jgi:CO/xanthine dehydrogenase Mo-binding subunit